MEYLRREGASQVHQHRQCCLIFRTQPQSQHHTITIHTNSLGVASSLWSESINSAIKLHHQTAIPDPTVAAQTRQWLLSLSSDTNRRLCDVRQREKLLRNTLVVTVWRQSVWRNGATALEQHPLEFENAGVICHFLPQRTLSFSFPTDTHTIGLHGKYTPFCLVLVQFC